MSETAQVRVTDDPGRERYEIRVGDELAGFVDYRLGEHEITFVHTEIEPRFGGRGLGSELVRVALRAAADAGRRVVPVCPFVADYLRTHPDEFRGLEVSPPSGTQPRRST